MSTVNIADVMTVNAVTALETQGELQGKPIPQVFLAGFEAGWKAALDLAIRVEQAINSEENEQ